MAKVFFLGTNMAATCLLLTILVKYAYEYQKNEFFEVQTLFDDERLPNVACLSPRGAKVWYELMQSDLEEALIIEKKIHLFFAQYVVPFHSAGYSNPALDKLLAAIGDWAPVGLRLRWPYLSIPSTELPELKKTARRMLPSFFFQ